jgi:hypothetical protein
MKRLFENPQRVLQLPRPVALAVQEMLVEIEVNGEHMAADEVVKLIEAVFSHLGRIWVAEYLNKGAFDENLNRELFETLGRNVSIGQWISMSRTIRALFQKHRKATLMIDLDAQDFGKPGEYEHPVAQLISYRNSFSHGSMSAVVEDIRKHRNLIEEVLMKLPCLIEQPIRVAVDENGGCLLVNGLWEPAAPAPPEMLVFQPFILSELPDEGETQRLELYPLLYVDRSGEEYEVKHASVKDTQHPVSRLFECEALRIWYERYERERLGFLDFQDSLSEKTSLPLPAESARELQEAIDDRAKNLILIRAYPGCGKTAAIISLLDSGNSSLKEHFSAVALYEVRSGHLSQSGFTFANFILRQIEQALEQESPHYQLNLEKTSETLDEAFGALKVAGKEILIGIEDLHLGQECYRREPLSVLDIYRMLPTRPLTVVSTVFHGSVRGPLFFDAVMDWPVVNERSLERGDLESVLQSLLKSSPPLHHQVLRVLSSQESGLDCFSVCDVLEADGQKNVFEPAVERAIWDLKPLLIEERLQQDRTRKWLPFSPEVKNTLEKMEVQ